VKIWCLLLVAFGCQNAAPREQPAASASAAPAASVAPVASATPKPWFEGAWQGTYQAELHRIELSAGGVKEWKKDDGSAASGAGTLSLAVTSDGSVNGTARGPLGEQQVSGRVEGDTVALSLVPAAADSFRGTILASKAPEGIKGTLQAASGDSLTVRKASVTLTKAAP
jgi:hypothetical protein